MRKIIHCDCDCFYASIEMRDNPQLANLPIAVGGSPERRGVIATCNYAARGYGIHSAMASATARKRCPDLIIIRPDMEKYRAASARIHDVFRRYTDIIEPLSLDEAFLDVSRCELFDGSATRIAEQIRADVRSEVAITISAGVAPNKFLAKIASDWQKPDGLFVIRPAEVDAFVRELPVKKLHGVGKVTAEKMHKRGIKVCADLQQFTREELEAEYGSFGRRLHDLCRGIDNRPVQTERQRKSVSVENTFSSDLPDLDSCLNALPDLATQLQERLGRLEKHYAIHKQFVKIKFRDFSQTTVEMLSQSLDLENFLQLCSEGYSRRNSPVRLLGLGVRVQAPAENEANDTSNDQLTFSLD